MGSSNVHTFLWDSVADGFSGTRNVVARVTPRNSQVGTPAQAQRKIGEESPLFLPEARVLLESTFGQPRPLAAGDLDGDGLADLVVAGTSDVAVLQGTANGPYAPPVGLGATAIPFALSLADMDRDGRLDIVGLDATTLTVWINQGALAFGAPIATPAAGVVSSLLPFALGDVSSDGIVDAVVVESSVVRVLLGDGTGAFVAGASFLISDVDGVALGDFDGDDLLDLVSTTANALAADVRLQKGDGLGSFGAETIVATSVFGSGLADVDGDRKLDVVLLSGFLPGRGDGTFGAPVAGPLGAFVDVDGSGRADFVTVNAAVVRARLRGESGFASELRVPVTGVSSLVVGDVDGDGQVDLLGTTQEGSGVTSVSRVAIRRGLAGPGYGIDPVVTIAPDDNAFMLATADLDGDGRLDVLVPMNQDSRLHIRLGQEGGGFGPDMVLASTLGFVFHTAVGDTDGDLIPDLVAYDVVDEVLGFYRGNGDGTFVETAKVAMSGGYHVALGDVDGNGWLDVIATKPSDAKLAVLLGTGAGAFDPPVESTIQSTNGLDAVLGDVDQDGDLDAVVSGDEVEVLLGTGNGTFVSTLFLVSPSSITATLADLDGDGRLDVVVGGFMNEVKVLFGRGGGVFGEAVRIARPEGIEQTPPIVGDLDGSGRLSIGAGSEGGFTVLAPRRRAEGPRGRGDGLAPGLSESSTVLRKTVLGLSPSAITFAAADVSQDGILDVLSVDSDAQLTIQVGGAAVASVAKVAGSRAVPVAPLPLDDLPTSFAGGATRLERASVALAFSPEERRLAVPATLAIPLHATFTRAELGGTFRVFRQEQDAPETVDRFGRRFHGRIVEVASTAMAGTGLATVDATAGTISFQVDRLGRYQVFHEASSSTSTIFRETFDLTAADRPFGEAPTPLGWVGTTNWQAGRAGASRPAVVSEPNLLAIGRRTSYRASTDESIASASFVVAASPAGRFTRLKLQEWHDLAAGDTVFVSLRLADQGGGPSTEVPVGSFTGTTAGNVELSEVVLDLDAAIGTGLSTLGALSANASIVFRLVSGAGPQGRGFFVDDLTVVQEP